MAKMSVHKKVTKRSLTSEMDRSIKRMLKLIEEDGDSFAKKAEMYYQKRPELIAHVEEFYRMYRSLAERYDHLTGELRKNIPSDLQLQGSGVSDYGSESASPLPNPEQKMGHRRCRSGRRAAGFDFFLGIGGGNSDLSQKEGDELSSTLSDSEPESDVSSTHNVCSPPMTGDGEGLRLKVIELEVELRDVKQKLRMEVEENAQWYKEEIRVANEKLRLLEEETDRLKLELENRSLELTFNFQAQMETAERVIKMREAELRSEKRRVAQLQEQVTALEAEVSDPGHQIIVLVEELSLTKEGLEGSENEIARLKNEFDEIEKKNSEDNLLLKDQLEFAQEHIATLEAELDVERQRVAELQETIEKYKADILERHLEVKELKAAMSNASQNFSAEKSQLQIKMSNLSREQILLQVKVRGWESQGQSMEEEIRQVEAEKIEMQGLYEAKEIGLKDEINRLKSEVAERGSRVNELDKNLDEFNLKHDMLVTERDYLNAKVISLTADMSSRDDRIDEMDWHLHQLHVELAELTASSQMGWKSVEELKLRVRELENEVERQKVVILDEAEKKREAIRQLCVSLEHYRNGYKELQQAFIGHKRLMVLAS